MVSTNQTPRQTRAQTVKKAVKDKPAPNEAKPVKQQPKRGEKTKTEKYPNLF